MLSSPTGSLGNWYTNVYIRCRTLLSHIEGFVVVFDCVVTGGTLKSEDGEATTFAFVAPEEMPPLMMPYPSALFARERRQALFE